MPEDSNILSLDAVASALATNAKLELTSETMGIGSFVETSAVLPDSVLAIDVSNPGSVQNGTLGLTGNFSKFLTQENLACTGILFDLEMVQPNGGTWTDRHLLLLITDFFANTTLFEFLGKYNTGFSSGNLELSSGDVLLSLSDVGSRHLLLSTIDFSNRDYKDITLPSEVAQFFAQTDMAATVSQEACRVGLNFKLEAAWGADAVQGILSHLTLATPGFVASVQSLRNVFHLSMRTDFEHSNTNSHNLQFDFKQAEVVFQLTESAFTFERFEIDCEVANLFNSNLQLIASLNIPTEELTLTALDFPTALDFFGGVLNRQNLVAPGHDAFSSLDQFLNFRIHEFSLRLGFKDFSLRALFFSIAFENKLPILPRILEVQPAFEIMALDPLNSGPVSMQIYGVCTIVGTDFDVAISPTDNYLRAQMAIGQSLDSGKLISLMGLPLPDPGIRLNDFELDASIAEKDNITFEAEIGVSTDWQVKVTDTLTFAFTELDVFVAYEQKSGVTDVALTGNFVLAGFHLQLLVEYMQESGWLIRGETAPVAVHFDDFANGLQTEHQLSAQPDTNDQSSVMHVISNEFNLGLDIKQILIEYAQRPSGEKRFLAIVSLATLASDTLPIAFDSIFLKLDVAAELNWECSLHVTFKAPLPEHDPIELLLASKKSEEGLIFEGELDNLNIGDVFLFFEDKFNLKQADLPGFLSDITLKKLTTKFFKPVGGGWSFAFALDGQLSIDGKQVETVLAIQVDKKADGFSTKFDGILTIGPFDQVGSLMFDLHIIDNAKTATLVASYKHEGGQQKISLKELVGQISTAAANDIPEGLSIDLKDAVFGFVKSANQTTFLFGLDLAASLNLTSLPLVGKEFSKDQTAGIDDLRVLAVSKAISPDQLSAINGLLPGGIGKLAGEQLGQGVTVSGTLSFGSAKQELSLPVAGQAAQNASTGSGNDTASPVPVTSSAQDGAKWFTLQKSFGPVHFERVGVQYKDGDLWFLLDGGLAVGPLTLTLDGLALGSPLDHFKPEFSLHGLGVDYKSGPIEIGGAFLHKIVTRDGVTYDEYDGAAIIRTEQLSLSAIGSYAYYNGHPSLFIYAVLDFPLGGPPFFFVTGLAGGFGYNRSIQAPAIDQVAQFPLVEEAVQGAGMPANLDDELEKLSQFLPPATGTDFLAIGIKFTSFKMIDSFALLIVVFGNRFEVDVLGLSTLIVPTPEAGNLITPLAEVQMALRVAFIPDEGFFGVQAQLTAASFILSRSCHLTGGFAFFSWFKGEHEGDFVQTIGGYHPQYKAPGHYPQVPRLGINWQVTSELSIKGDAYYALTSHALMAGGHLQATWQSGSLKAWFTAGADFLIAWKPYHYDALVYVDMGVSYTFHFFGTHHITVDVGADLHIWGPEFSGIAHIKLWIVSFSVSFGANALQTPQPIPWAAFKSSFLPKDEDIVGIAITGGLLTRGSGEAGDLGVVNPKNLELVSNAVIPSKTHALAGGSLDTEGKAAKADFGVAPVNVAADDLSSVHHIAITHEDSPSDEFVFKPVLKKIPAGLWGESLKPDVNGRQFIDDTLSGFVVTPAAPMLPDQTPFVDKEKLQFETHPVNKAFEWEAYTTFKKGAAADLAKIGQNRRRNSMLQAMGFDASEDVNVSAGVADEFVVDPVVLKEA